MRVHLSLASLTFAILITLAAVLACGGGGGQAYTPVNVKADCYRDCRRDHNEATRSCNQRCAQSPNQPDCVASEQDWPSASFNQNRAMLKTFTTPCLASAQFSVMDCNAGCRDLSGQ